MSSAAQSSAKAGRIISDRDVRAFQQRRGDDADVDRYLNRQLAQGAGLSRQVVKEYGDRDSDYFTPQQRLTRYALETYAGDGNPLAAGITAAGDIGKGNVYLGATAPRNPGGSPSPAGSGYNAIVAPRWMVKGAARPAPESTGSSAAAADPRPFTPSTELTAAQTEALDRAQQWRDSSAAAPASAKPALDAGNIYGEVFALGAGQVDDYKNRFLPMLDANARAQTAELGEATRYHLSQLSPDVKPSDALAWRDIKKRTRWSIGQATG